MKSNLNKHVSTVHEGIKPFQCDICNACFGQKDNLNNHIAIVHEGIKQFKCDICHAGFGRKGNLNKNLKLLIKERNHLNVAFVKLNLHQNMA